MIKMKEKLFFALAEVFEIDVNNIKEENIFRDYENYSSLTELSILAMLDSEFGIEIEMKEYNNYKTIGNLLQLVIERSAI